MHPAAKAVKERLSLREVVSRRVALYPAGKGRWRGLCPFHGGEAPSFHVDEEKGLFYCFACGEGGDLIRFVERAEGLGFAEALGRLAAEAGVPFEPPRLLEVLEEAHRYFQKALERSSRAMAYLRERGLREEVVWRFGLGYAPPYPEGLAAHLRRKGLPLEEGVRAGVLVEREGRLLDRFQGRIVFPVRDPLGRVVGFLGRALGRGEPKYLSTPETPLFRKREALFAYPEARPRLKGGRAILVEGPFDALALHQLGFGEAVAVLGSALSEEQALLLRREGVREVYLAFDRDEAGLKAALEGLKREALRGIPVRAVLLPVKDPGELLLLEKGHLLFRKALAEALPGEALLLRALREAQGPDEPGRKRKALEALIPRMASRGPGAEELRARVSGSLGLPREALEELLQGLAPTRPRTPPPGPDGPGRTLLLELDLLALVLSAPDEELPGIVRYVLGEVWPPPGSLLGELLEELKAKLAASPRGEDLRDLIRLRLGGRPEGETLSRHPLPAPPKDEALEERLARALARLREAYHLDRLEALREELRQNPSEEVLREIHEVVQAAEAERRVYMGV